MRFLQSRKSRIVIYSLFLLSILTLFPPVILEIYINSDSFRKRISDEINKRAKFENFILSYEIGDIGIFSGIKFSDIHLKSGGKEVAEFHNCSASGLLKKVLFNKNNFRFSCKKGRLDLTYIEKFKGSNKGIEQQGAKRSYDIGLKINDFEVEYKRFSARFELSGRYSQRDKFFEIELKDRYRIRVTDIDLNSKSARISFAGIDIPFLLNRYLGRYSEIVEGKIDGSALIKKDGQEIVVEFSNVSVNNLSLNHPLISERGFGIKKFVIDGRLSLSMASGLMRLIQLNADISDMIFSLSGRLYNGKYSLDLMTRRLNIKDLAAFFGGEEFEGFNMGGEIKIKASISGDLKGQKKIEDVSISGDVIKPVQLSQRLNYLKSDFSYTFINKNGKEKKIQIGTKNPYFVHIADIPSYVYGAVVVSEDAGFFGHKGVEFKEIESAIIDNIESDRPYLRGGSTITQQLAKNLFLGREKTLLRKMKELLLAIELDATLSKERILEIYLNGIEWGPEIFGIGAASQHYFGKAPSELRPIEAAYLASIIPNPSRYYVYFVKKEVPEKWYQKVQSILYRMNLFGYLGDDEYNKSLNEKIEFEHTTGEEVIR